MLATNKEKILIQLENFFQDFQKIEVSKHEVVLKPDDSLEFLYYVKSGYIKQYSVSSSGEEFILNIFRPGSYFAIALTTDQQINNYYFEALTEVELYKASAREVLTFIKKDSTLLFDLYSRISSGMSALALRMESLVFGSARAKISATLYLNARRFGKNNGEKVTIDFPLTHLQIANMTGVTRETVSIEMMKLKKDKIIDYKGQKVTVLDMKKLNQASSLSQHV